jgi:hypothetical protein
MVYPFKVSSGRAPEKQPPIVALPPARTGEISSSYREIAPARVACHGLPLVMRSLIPVAGVYKRRLSQDAIFCLHQAKEGIGYHALGTWASGADLRRSGATDHARGERQDCLALRRLSLSRHGSADQLDGRAKPTQTYDRAT